MATRSTIAVELEDGTVQQIYCHWDGYLEHNGAILQQHYTDPAKVQQLISLGDLSSLGAEIGEQHEFSNPHKYGTPEYSEWQEQQQGFCTFYARDRGETGVAARVFKSFADYKKNHQYEEYEYILRSNGLWYVSTGKVYGLLVEALELEPAAA